MEKPLCLSMRDFSTKTGIYISRKNKKRGRLCFRRYTVEGVLAKMTLCLSARKASRICRCSAILCPVQNKESVENTEALAPVAKNCQVNRCRVLGIIAVFYAPRINPTRRFNDGDPSVVLL